MKTKEKALEIFGKYYEQWENNEDRMKNGFEYERSFVEMMHKVELEVLEASSGNIPKDKNQKKNFKRV